MSRRRRLLPLAIYNENAAGEDDFEPRMRQPPAQPDPRNSQWLTKTRVTIHPSLSNYGPESLQCFLRDELEKLTNNALDEQRKMIVEFARFLVNNPNHLHVVNDNSSQRFTIVPTNGSSDTFENTDKSKGKAPVTRASHQKALIDVTEDESQAPDRKRRFTNTSRADVQSLAPGKPRKPGRPPRLTNATGSRNIETAPAKFRASDTTAANKGKQTAESQSPQLIGNALNNIDLNQGASRPVLRSGLRTTQSHPLSKPQPVVRPNLRRKASVSHNAFDLLNDPVLQPNSASTSLPSSSKPVPPVGLSSSPGQLTRAASFETHTDHTREISRTRAKAPMSSGQSPEESRRRRKTPTHPHGRPSHITPSIPTRDASQGTDAAQTSGFFLDGEFRNMDGSRPGFFNPFSSPDDVIFEQSAAFQPSMPHQIPALEDAIMADSHGDDGNDFLSMVKRHHAMLGRSFEEQQAGLASSDSAATAAQPEASSSAYHTRNSVEYDYSQIIPEDLPDDFKKAAVNRRKIWDAHGHDSNGKPPARPSRNGPFTAQQLDPRGDNLLNALDDFGDYQRPYLRPSRRNNPRDPPSCPPPSQVQHSLPHEIWEAGVLGYLSSSEVRTLRLVCKSIAEDLEPYVFRNVVANFGPSFFSIDNTIPRSGNSDKVAPMAMLEKFGPGINKFGISFEYDQMGMTKAPFKVTETTVNAWFGHYKWPVKDYPYFAPLKDIDALLDDQPRLLIHAMKKLTSCHELALSVDSGHGWLDGPDVSDLALYRERARGGTRVFGKTFPSTDRAYEDGLKELFHWAQRNTINENIKYYERDILCNFKDEIERLQDIQIRDYESYLVQDQQPDFEKDLHTGRVLFSPVGQPNNPLPFNAMNPFNNLPIIPPMGQFAPPNPPTPSRIHAQRYVQAMRLATNRTTAPEPKEKGPARKRKPIHPQWPIIYSGYNISADVGGDLGYVQDRVFNPSDYPLMPGYLTEAQAQWLMETSWIQRTFLTSYTDAIRSNANVFKNVHSLHISKMSSGLLSSFTHKTFWLSLPNLRTLTIFVKPDWRVEHVPGDKLYRNTMASKLIDATLKFTHLLRNIIARVESINDLHLGYCSGGEHQRGIFGRNQHILPAPIVTNPREWLLAQNPTNPKAEEDTMFVFPHVRNLKFENCWFSPGMLETFMQKSQDSSLHNLILDSVSLTSMVNSARTDGPLRTFDHQLRCQHPQGAWLQETVPANASWVHVLDKITPGRTILDQKYDASMINEEHNPRPEVQFRGNTQSITLKSCGYVKIQGIASTEFNQNDLVFHSAEWKAFDDGLKTRAGKFIKTIYPDGTRTVCHDGTNQTANSAASRTATSIWNAAARVATRHGDAALWEDSPQELRGTSQQFIMQGGQTGHELLNGSHNSSVSGFDLTGFLTQCIHPVEKRILEQNWGMMFGWDDDMTRWEAVEDGWFIGGTGRFSGTVYKDSKVQDAVNAARLEKMAKSEAENDSDKIQTADTTTARDIASATAPAAGPATRRPVRSAPPNIQSSTQIDSVAGPSRSRPQLASQATDWILDNDDMNVFLGDQDVVLNNLTVGNAGEDDDDDEDDDYRPPENDDAGNEVFQNFI